MKKIMHITILLFCFFIIENAHAYYEYDIGQSVTYHGEKYYVIEKSDSQTNYITILRDKPLTIEEINKYGKDDNGNLFVNKYHYNASNPEQVIYEYNDIGGIAYYSKDNCKLAVTQNSSDQVDFENIDYGCTNNYQSSDVKKVIDNWAKQYEQDLVSINGQKTRILKASEFIDKFNIETFANNSCYVYNDRLQFKWLYNNIPNY